MIPRVYIDTSVIGGCLDEQFKEHSERLFTDFEADRLRAVISNITIAEVLQAPEEVKSLLQHPALKKAEKVYLDEEAVVLAEAYIQEGVVSESNRVDAQHIAVATVYRVDILVSWNFHHIVKWSRIRAFNGVNLKRGYPQLEIHLQGRYFMKKDKGIDAVKMMRAIRDRMSEEMKVMSPREQIEYIEKKSGLRRRKHAAATPDANRQTR